MKKNSTLSDKFLNQISKIVEQIFMNYELFAPDARDMVYQSGEWYYG